ncbi:molecular chaperone Tir [Nonlabens sp. MIC269]|uniref:YbjN domain-containing protein n=1 Tax=Nonlabens TaxID=363408 RepID=UPI00071F7CCF|nr:MULTISPECIES: YbjN domain-containing protein [Nonlabens]ALM21098.1 molecular chaperone Tir [Nonlabens sp. MIC269]ARN72182.1 molecular chaperone Tir [Nonlabens tegetincola]MEE2802764.1 YbjN domain-containing protein [Bacteroidota bacterium]PQJ20202.1 molecular chaperone Tir [Nonlabens tegetincola]
MNDHYQKIKEYLQQLDFDITRENPSSGILVIEKEDVGIKNLIMGIAPPILIMEQYIFKINNHRDEVFKSLLQKNRDIIHGAFVLDETGTKVIFRDTLQIENLDLNELEGSLNSLSLLLSEYSDQIITFSKY